MCTRKAQKLTKRDGRIWARNTGRDFFRDPQVPRTRKHFCYTVDNSFRWFECKNCPAIYGAKFWNVVAVACAAFGGNQATLSGFSYHTNVSYAKRDCCHRWAHAFAKQRNSSVITGRVPRFWNPTKPNLKINSFSPKMLSRKQPELQCPTFYLNFIDFNRERRRSYTIFCLSCTK